VSAVFTDSTKVYCVNDEGRFFNCRGPLNVTRSPQNGPAIIQAGASPRRQAFAANYAKAILAVQPFSESAREEFVDMVVPVPQRRVLFRSDYVGKTQCENL
jgi:long-chain alkane monooxygenase